MPVLSFPWRRSGAVAPSEPAPPPGLRSSDLLATAVDLLPDAVLVVGRIGSGPIRILASNEAARDLLALRPDEDQLVAGLRQPDVLAAVEDALNAGKDHSVSYETPGPRPRALRVWVRPLAAIGQPSAVIALRDETEARRLERMRVDFLANASHELRTPLASLAGFVETLQGHAKNDPEARDRFLEIMSGQARRMSQLIDDLLSLSRIEMNEHVPPSGACDLALLAREAADGLLPAIVNKGSTLNLSGIPAGKALVAGDRDQLAQVVQNLMENAVKYSPDGEAVSVQIASDVPFEADLGGPEIALLRQSGGGRLVLLSPEHSHENSYVRISIADRGPGIAREHLPRLTERFYRVPGQKSSEVSGTGLGLAIVKHILNRHRGGLLVESAPGQGTTFTAYLPVAGTEGAPAAVTKVL